MTMRLRTNAMARQQWWRRVMRPAAAGLGVALVAAGAPLVAAPTASAQYDTCEVKKYPSSTKHTVCMNKTLRTEDFDHQDVRWGEFNGSIFSGSKRLYDVNLVFANLSNADLRDVEFDKTSVAGGTLENANLEGASLTNDSTLAQANVGKSSMMPKASWPGSWVTTEMLLEDAKARLVTGTHIIGCEDTDDKHRTKFVANEGPFKTFNVLCEFTDKDKSWQRPAYGRMRLQVRGIKKGGTGNYA
jgi:hypothetical protein